MWPLQVIPNRYVWQHQKLETKIQLGALRMKERLPELENDHSKIWTQRSVQTWNVVEYLEGGTFWVYLHPRETMRVPPEAHTGAHESPRAGQAAPEKHIIKYTLAYNESMTLVWDLCVMCLLSNLDVFIWNGFCWFIIVFPHVVVVPLLKATTNLSQLRLSLLKAFSGLWYRTRRLQQKEHTS